MMLCTSCGRSGFAMTANFEFVDNNSATRPPKIQENISKFNLIIANFEKNYYQISSLN